MRHCAAEDMKPGAPQPDLPADAGEATIATLDKLRNSSGSLPVAKLRKRLQIAMQQDAAVFRTEVRPRRSVMHAWSLRAAALRP